MSKAKLVTVRSIDISCMQHQNVLQGFRQNESGFGDIFYIQGSQCGQCKFYIMFAIKK